MVNCAVTTMFAVARRSVHLIAALDEFMRASFPSFYTLVLVMLPAGRRSAITVH